MGRPVYGAKLRGPEAGQCLHLITTGEIRKLARVCLPYALQPLGQHIQRGIPGDGFELSGTAFAARFAQ